MLSALRIENFAIVKELDLDFSEGMIAFTGETGAGKSILIDALMLAMGDRADASVVRPGESKCDISALFHYQRDSEPAQWLTSHDVETTDEQLILRRIITAEGRSKCTINGQPFSLQKVKELGEMLVHIHGQHQHQTLLQHPTHRQHLDDYAGLQNELKHIQQLYKKCQQIEQAIEALNAQDSHQDKMALLQFQIDELQTLNLHEGELEVLSRTHQELHHAHDYLQHCVAIQSRLAGDESGDVCQLLNQVMQLFKELPENNAIIRNARDMVASALIQCEEAHDEVQRFAEKVQLDPERLRQVEDRLGELHRFARKYQVEPRALFEHFNELQQQLDQLKNQDQRLAQLQHEYQQFISEYQQQATKLHQLRTKAAPRLAQEISEIIRQLGMPKGRVEIDISVLEKMHPHGMDKVEYKVCTNPGMAAESLAKIASGGELSRISLAIQMITAQRGATPTLMFDEVDVGIGGATAALVGRLLRRLGKRLQLFCVTHQPQVAAAAHHHFVVEKEVKNQHTFSKITMLEENAKISEIARMLGGLTITEQTRSHAKEMLTVACLE